MGRRLQCEVGRRVSHRPVGVLLPCAVAPCRSRTQCSRRACCAGASTWLKIFARLIAPKWRCRQSWSLHGIPGLCLGFSCYLTPNLRCCGRRANGLIVGLRRGGGGTPGTSHRTVRCLPPSSTHSRRVPQPGTRGEPDIRPGAWHHQWPSARCCMQ